MSPASRFIPASPSYTVVKKRSPLEDGLPRMKWRQRMKTDFFLAKEPFRAKTRGMAIRVALSPFWPVSDLVNPVYIQKADHQWAKSIENLVLAVRGLTSKSYKNAQQSLRRIPLFATILQVIREWDVETMNRELILLQREPRGRTFAEFAPLVTAVLRPYFLLSRLSPHVHLLPAIAKMHEFAKMYLTSKDERELLQRYYGIAREELPLVFSYLRQSLYPVLLKLLSDQFLDPDQFYHDKEAEIFALLGITDQDLIRDVPEPGAKTPGAAGAGAVAHAGPERPPRLAAHGLQLLDQLFPRAGWNQLAEKPDLYSYFESVFAYPKGSDLVPVDDPIQVIQPLSEVLQQLYYGFQNVQWGTVVNPAGEVIRLQELFDKAIARWHFFYEEFFGKNYLPLLQEYCREIERTGPLSNDAKRKEHLLLWFKRNYLLPHLSLPIMDDVRVKSLGYPSLSIQVKEMLDLLGPIALDLEKNGNRSTALLNGETKATFPVSSLVSHRFQSVLKRTETGAQGEKRILDQGNHRSLLFYALSLLTVLDHLLTHPGSQFYAAPQAYLFRTSGAAGDDKPVYNAPKKNTAGFLKKLNDQPPPEAGDQPWQTQVGSLYEPLLAAGQLRARVQEFQNDKKPFAVVSFRVWPPEAGPEFRALATPLLDQGTELHSLDDGSWVQSLRDTLEEEAEDFAKKILVAGAAVAPPLALGVLVVPGFLGVTPEKIAAIISRGWSDAREIPPQILGVWIPSAQTFEFRTNVPTVAVGTAEEEAAPSLA